MRRCHNKVALALLLITLLLWGQSLWIFAKAQLAQVLIAESWQRSLENNTAEKPWPWADTWPVARLTFPEKQRELFVLSGASGSTLAFGPGLDPTSTNEATILHGHRDTHFSILESLKIGEPIELQYQPGITQRFIVSETKTIDLALNQWRLDVANHVLYLITCYPFDSIVPGGSQRFIVVAKPSVEKLAPASQNLIF